MYKLMNLWKLNVHHAPDTGNGSGGTGDNGAGDDGAGDSGSGADNGDQAGAGNGGSDKTFTQEEVNRIMSREKRRGEASLLRKLGLNPDDKDVVTNLKKLLDDQQTDSEKKDKSLKDAQDTATKETARADAAERKLKVLMAGCQKAFVEEVTTLASAKVSDDMDFDEALEEVKKKFSAFFGGDGAQDDTGTGQAQGHRRQNNAAKPGSFGAKLAQSASTPKNNPYFNN